MLRTAGCVLLSAILILGGMGTASAFDKPTRALAYTSFKNAFYNANGGGPGFFINQQGHTTQQMSFWTMSEMIEVTEDTVGVGIEPIAMVNSSCINFTNNNNNWWSWNLFNDDLAWASMAFSRAYAMTGNTTWRTLAKNAADDAWNRGWDTANGGMYQRDHSGSKATCANAPAGDAFFMLYQSLGDSNYRTKAQQELNWMNANGVYDPASGKVIVGPGAGNPSHSYDCGTYATLALWLGDSTAANKVGDFVQSQWGTSMQSFGQGSDAGGFNGICLRGLARTGHNIAFLQAACDKAWSCRNNSGLTSVNFGSRTADGTQLWSWDCSDMIAGMMCVPAAPASITSGQIYQLEPQNALGKRLDVTAGGGAGSKMEIYTSNNGNGQKFRINAMSGQSGVYQLVPQCSTTSCLDVVGSGINTGTLVDIWNNTSSFNQQWIIIPVDEANHVYMLEPLNATNLRLDVVGNGTANGTGVDVWTSNNGSNQKWILH
ncbi:MAG: glycoside hydrolase family 76 [Verrucomicrobiales bacterium]|nr:glycoside hydrolase family 76 [Verrucomicrobiales bacterium]